ncbi:MAG: hypothetical protein Q4C96_03760 [Planctomycetia bacterium]|nr:hypothetical protein [Planctomycetia bacterium]
MKSILSFLLLCSLIFFTGCTKEKTHPNRVSMTGKVMFQNVPLAAGMISLVSAENALQQASAILRPDGTFTIMDAPKGKVLITVDTTTFSPDSGGNAETYRKIPARYASSDTSGLEITIPDSGIQDYVITLEEK